MTKEELIKRLIEMRKTGADETLDRVCESSTGCEDCPLYSTGRLCSHQVIDYLLDHIIDHETPQETNLEHYFNAGDVIVYLGQQIIHLNDNCWDAYWNSRSPHIIEWLLLPYEEPPKPKYKLSKFEYDLLKCYCEPLLKINDIWILAKMKSMGYFKDIPHNVSIEAILDNCEVIDSEID